jgi:hypothetical protein
LDRIAELAQTLAPLLEDAADAGVRKSSGDRFVGRGAGFTDSDPTGTAALDPTRRQMRAAVRRAVTLILRAEDELQEAGAVIANGYLRLDREEWVRVVEKRSAALQGRQFGARVPRRGRRFGLVHEGSYKPLGCPV